jgi:hypothetical protein
VWRDRHGVRRGRPACREFHQKRDKQHQQKRGPENPVAETPVGQEASRGGLWRRCSEESQTQNRILDAAGGAGQSGCPDESRYCA